MEILKENIPLDEKLTKIYLKALDMIDEYSPVQSSYVPKGWVEEYEFYQGCESREKSQAWKNINGKFYGYLKAKDEADSKNKSNKSFLKDIHAHFIKVGLLKHADLIKHKLHEFESILV